MLSLRFGHASLWCDLKADNTHVLLPGSIQLRFALD